MISNYLAGLGLEPIHDGDPYVVSLISQGRIIRDLQSDSRFKEIWEKVERTAQQQIDKQGVVRIQLIYISFVDDTIEKINNNFDLSIVKSHTILSAKNPKESDFVKSDVLIILFS